MRKLQFSVIFLLSFTTAYSQSLRYAVGMPYIGLGAYSASQKDVFSFSNNQAALAGIRTFNAGIFGERRFMLAENSSYTMAAAFPTSKGNFGVQLNYAGFADFNENKLGLAYARSLGKKVDVGIQFNHYGYKVAGYGNSSSINFEAGLLLHFSDKLTGGVHVYNPVGGRLSKTADEKLASAYKFGLGYDASENFFVSAEIVKEEGRPVNVVGGIQYHFMKQFFVRAGFVSESGSGFGGAGMAWKNIRLDLSASYHPQLGISPGILLISNFMHNQK